MREGGRSSFPESAAAIAAAAPLILIFDSRFSRFWYKASISLSNYPFCPLLVLILKHGIMSDWYKKRKFVCNYPNSAGTRPQTVKEAARSPEIAAAPPPRIQTAPRLIKREKSFMRFMCFHA